MLNDEETIESLDLSSKMSRVGMCDKDLVNEGASIYP